MCALDSDLDVVTTARGLSGGSLPAVCAAAAALPFRDGRFEGILCVDLFHWAAGGPALRRILDEAWRVLRPGGELAARFLCRDLIPDALPLGDGRYRLETGAEWFLPDLDFFREFAREAGAPPPETVRDGAGAVMLRLRRPLEASGFGFR